MPFLTKQERQVLIYFAVIIFLGSVLQCLAKRWRPLSELIGHIDSGKVYYKTDLNRASYDDLLRIPYIGEKTARNILEYRQAKGPFKDCQELLAVKGIKEKNFQRFSPYLTIKN